MHGTLKLLFECYIIVSRHYYCWVYFYFMVKPVKSFVKIGSCLQTVLFFLFYQHFQTPTPPPPRLFWPVAYLILPSVPTTPLMKTHHLFGTQKKEFYISNKTMSYYNIYRSVLEIYVPRSCSLITVTGGLAWTSFHSATRLNNESQCLMIFSRQIVNKPSQLK